MQVYAMEEQEDGSAELREFQITDTDTYEIYEDYTIKTVVRICDGKYMYKELLIKCDGNNIKNVEFFVDNDGLFAVSMAKSIIESWELEKYYDDNGNELGWGKRGQIDDPEIMGASYKIDWKDMNDDLMLLVGKPYQNGADTPYFNNITVRAVATFNDGTTQEKSIKLW